MPAGWGCAASRLLNQAVSVGPSSNATGAFSAQILRSYGDADALYDSPFCPRIEQEANTAKSTQGNRRAADKVSVGIFIQDARRRIWSDQSDCPFTAILTILDTVRPVESYSFLKHASFLQNRFSLINPLMPFESR
jgi:hypothetical protein